MTRTMTGTGRVRRRINRDRDSYSAAYTHSARGPVRWPILNIKRNIIIIVVAVVVRPSPRRSRTHVTAARINCALAGRMCIVYTCNLRTRKMGFTARRRPSMIIIIMSTARTCYYYAFHACTIYPKETCFIFISPPPRSQRSEYIRSISTSSIRYFRKYLYTRARIHGVYTCTHYAHGSTHSTKYIYIHI